MQKRFPKTQSPNEPDDTAGFDWNDLKYFLAVARQGGLSKAALQLDTSASTVSRHIGALEQRLNVRLFVRLSTGYLLTDAGSELFDRVADVERSTHALERRSSATANADKVEGLVRLAATEALASHALMPMLTQLRQRHPGLRVEMVLSYSPVDLTRREADLALRVMDADMSGAHPDHVMHRVATMGFGLYAARSLLADAGGKLNGDIGDGEVDWAALDHVSWDTAWRHLPAAKWMGKAYANKAPVFTSNSLTAQAMAVRSGMGVGVLPDYMARSDKALVRLPVDLSELRRDLWLVYHGDLRGSSRVQAVRGVVEEVLPGMLG